MTRFYSPLRYPGGKQKLSELIGEICVDNGINGHYVEPYAGGASVALYLLLANRVKEITINDLDKAVYAFWWSVKYEVSSLCEMIDETSVTIEEWKKQKAVLTKKDGENDLVKLGFATLFLNRTNYSGVLNAGVIGGMSQNGNYKIDCRFNKASIKEKIKAIACERSRIHVSNMDALDLIDSIDPNDNTIFYFDPPYFLKGPSLYMNHYKNSDHEAVSTKIKSIKNAKWIVSYDDASEIRKLYVGPKSHSYNLHHCVHSSRAGKEVIFFSDNLAVGQKMIVRFLGVSST